MYEDMTNLSREETQNKIVSLERDIKNMEAELYCCVMAYQREIWLMYYRDAIKRHTLLTVWLEHLSAAVTV